MEWLPWLFVNGRHRREWTAATTVLARQVGRRPSPGASPAARQAAAPLARIHRPSTPEAVLPCGQLLRPHVLLAVCPVPPGGGDVRRAVSPPAGGRREWPATGRCALRARLLQEARSPGAAPTRRHQRPRVLSPPHIPRTARVADCRYLAVWRVSGVAGCLPACLTIQRRAPARAPSGRWLGGALGA